MNPINITLRQLRAFKAIVETGSFTKAAEQLHITQSALSGLIKEFENILDLRLFDRTTRTLSLSTTGQHIYPMVTRILYDVENMAVEVGRLKDLESGSVKVAVSQQLAASVIPTVIAKFMTVYPNIKVTLDDCSVDSVIESVNTGVVDFGIGPERDIGDSLSGEMLFDLPFYVVVPNNHPFVELSHVNWNDLQHETLITLSGMFGQLLIQDLPIEYAEIIKNATHRVNFLTTAFSMVAQNLGVTFCLPYSRARVAQSGLQMRLLIEPRISRPTFLYRKRGRPLSNAAHKFYVMLCQYLQENQYD